MTTFCPGPEVVTISDIYSILIILTGYQALIYLLGYAAGKISIEMTVLTRSLLHSLTACASKNTKRGNIRTIFRNVVIDTVELLT